MVEAYVKKRLINGVRFAEKIGFNIAMYSWEMELDLDDIDITFDGELDLNFRKAIEDDFN